MCFGIYEVWKLLLGALIGVAGVCFSIVYLWVQDVSQMHVARGLYFLFGGCLSVIVSSAGIALDRYIDAPPVVMAYKSRNTDLKFGI